MSSFMRAPSSGPRRWRPGTTLGWWAVAVAAAAVICMMVFPMLTVNYRETYPITDSWVMPTLLTAVFDLAFLLSVLAVWRRRERSLLNLIVLAITSVAALFSTLTVIGETFVVP